MALDQSDELRAGELATLIRIEDFRMRSLRDEKNKDRMAVTQLRSPDSV